MVRRSLLLLAVTLAASAPVAAQHPGAAPTGRASYTPPPEARQFDFLIGQWELVVMPKVSSLAARIHGAPRLLGTFKAWRAVDGFGIEDELRIVDGSGNPSALTHALRIYSTADRKWIVLAADAYRGRGFTSTAEWQSNAMVSSGQGTDQEGKPYLTRTRYYDITPTSFRFQQDRSLDGGRTWDEGTLRMEAKRVAAVAPR
jgi:hypothetical protein